MEHNRYPGNPEKYKGMLSKLVFHQSEKSKIHNFLNTYLPKLAKLPEHLAKLNQDQISNFFLKKKELYAST